MNARTYNPNTVVSHDIEQAVRKQVTVLFCDVADYTSRSSSMDPEDLSDEIRVFQSLCTDVADKYHGHISNYLGDGILVLFGHPTASEFDVEHALRAGMEMIEEIEQNNLSFEWRSKTPISIRVGIATSLVVVGEKAGKQRDQDELIFGEAPSLAARLQSMAEPNTVVTSLRTRRLVGSAFNFRDLGEQHLKGFSSPIPAWQLLGESTFQSRNYTSLKRVTTRFVSRQKELSFLTDCYERAINQGYTSVHVIGEAGIGKSRLVRVFEKTLKKQDINRIRISCSPYYHSTPLKPVIDEFYRWIQISVDHSPAEKHKKIKQALVDLNINDPQSLAILCDLLSIEPLKSEPLAEISAEEKHQLSLQLLGNIVFSLSKTSPVLLILEDLHWCDPTTLEALEYLVRNGKNCKIFSILTSRPDFQAKWKQSDFLMNLVLEKLNLSDSRALIKSVFGSTYLPHWVEQTLIEKSDGVPLYLEECSWHILNQALEKGGILDVSEDFTVPDTLQDSLNARLDSLGPAKELAQLASVFGTLFTYSDIEKIAHINGIDADNSMDVLLQAKLLKTVPNQDEDRYVFRHAMFQDAAYHSLLKKTRQHYHLQIAELFIHEYPKIKIKQPELLAYHFSRTDQLETATKLWVAAGKNAISNSAIGEALDHLNRGLQIIPSLPESDSTSKLELSLLLNLAVCYTLRSGYFGQQVTETYERCIEIAASVGNEEQQWSALYGFWRCLICKAQFAKAMTVSVKLKRLSYRLEDRKLFMTSTGIQGMTRMFAGKFLSAEKFYEDSVQGYDHVGDSNIGVRFGQDPYVTIQGLGAVNRLIRNRPELSRQEIEKSVNVSRNVGHPYTIAETLRVAAMYEQISRDMVALRKYAEEAIELSEKFGFEGLLAASNIFFAFSDVVCYRNNDKIETIRQNLTLYKEKYALLLYPYFQGLLAEALLYMHRFQEAFTESIHVMLLIDKHGEMWARVPVMLIRAEAAARGKLAGNEEIKRWYDEAESLAREQNAELFKQRIQLSRSEFFQASVTEHPTETTFVFDPDCDSTQSDSLDQPSVSQYIVFN